MKNNTKIQALGLCFILISTVSLAHACNMSDESKLSKRSVDAEGVKVTDGIDAFIIRKGKIMVQTIYYTSNSKYSKELQK